MLLTLNDEARKHGTRPTRQISTASNVSEYTTQTLTYIKMIPCYPQEKVF